MTILRSKVVAGQAVALASSGVERAMREWDAKVSAAQEKGRLAGLAEAQTRIEAAEKRARDAEAAAQKKQAEKQAALLAQFEPILTSLASAAARLEPLEKQLILESEAETVRLSLTIAATVLRKAVETDPTWMDALVKRALLEVPDRRQVVLRMHPNDAKDVRDRVTDIGARIPGLEKIDIIDDTTLARGSCILQSQGTRLDASVPGCWERLAKELLDSAPSSDCVILARPGDAQNPAPGATP
jgi:flagellar biosynthesis/type III secretory pathway protein FliH